MFISIVVSVVGDKGNGRDNVVIVVNFVFYFLFKTNKKNHLLKIKGKVS